MGTTELKSRGVNEDRLTDKQRIFLYQYLVDSNSKRAAIAAGYSEKTATQKGAQLLQHPLIKAQLGKLQRQDVIKLELSREEILKQLYYACTRDVGDFEDENGQVHTSLRAIPERLRACIDGFEVEQQSFTDRETGETTITQKIKVKLSPKLGAIDLAMKHKGLFAAEKHEVTVGVFNWDALAKAPEQSNIIEARVKAMENPE